jgi:hypothetical protein
VLPRLHASRVVSHLKGIRLHAEEETRTMNRLFPFALAVSLVVPVASAAETAAPAETVLPGVATTTPGRAIIETVDPRASHVLLRYDDGTLRTYRTDPASRDLATLNPGDTITVELAESVVVRWMHGDGHGVMDGPIEGATARLFGTVEEMDPDGRTAVLRGAAGERHRVVLPAEIDASMVQPGEQVSVELTEAVLVRVGPG